MRTTAEAIRQFKHICWYPSAGVDFKPLLFISDWYYKKNNVPTDEGQALPDLFIFTDYMGFHAHEMQLSSFGEAYDQIQNGFCEPDSCLIHVPYKNSSTDIIVKSFEKLHDVNLPFSSELASTENNLDYNSSMLMNVEVVSRINDDINRYEVSVLYLAVLNEYFAERILIPNNIKTEYLIIVNYGTGFGGGRGKGYAWILGDYKELGIKYLISNEYVSHVLAEYESDKPKPTLSVIHDIDGFQWDKGSRITWYKLS